MVKNKKQANEQTLFDDHQATDIERYLKRKHAALDIAVPAFLQELNSVVIKDQFGMIIKLEKGVNSIISGGDNNEEEWVMGISQLIQAASFDGHFCTFIDGKCYIPGLLHGNVIRHTWTLTAKLLPRTYTRDSVQPVANVKSNIVYAESSSLPDPNSHLVIDVC